jgi:hypothetical protein
MKMGAILYVYEAWITHIKEETILKLDHLQKDVDDTAVADEAHEEEDYEDDGGDVTDHRMLDHEHDSF